MPEKPFDLRKFIADQKDDDRQEELFDIDAVDSSATMITSKNARPGLEKITARVPTWKLRQVKHLCAIHGLKLQDVIEMLITKFNENPGFARKTPLPKPKI